MFESVQVDLQGVSLLEQAGRDALINFANSGIGYIDYESYLAEVRGLGGVGGAFSFRVQFRSSAWLNLLGRNCLN